MKKIIIAFLLLTSALIAQGEKYSTTAKLPENEMIWPPIDFSEIENGIPISGEFVESKSILVVDQGDWAEHTYLVKYKVTKGHKNYPHDEISFICNRTWPTAESGIKMKALRYHFREGLMDFVLQKDERVQHMDYFKIGAYKNK